MFRLSNMTPIFWITMIFHHDYYFFIGRDCGAQISYIFGFSRYFDRHTPEDPPWHYITGSVLYIIPIKTDLFLINFETCTTVLCHRYYFHINLITAFRQLIKPVMY